jgi:FKBP-type peptidyl-prolyl cis-trans isomerase SlyD
MQVADKTVVSIDYTLTNDAGEVLDSSKGAEPLTYIHGTGQIISGLENALAGKQQGDSLKVRLEAHDAYGDRDESKVMTATRAQFGGDEPEVGLQVSADGPGGSEVLRIVAVDNDVVTLDGNHPLAGVPLTFDVTVVGIRAATKQELKHGHAHGSHGHDH